MSVVAPEPTGPPDGSLIVPPPEPAPAPTPPVAPPPADEVYSKQYVEDLRREAQQHRERAEPYVQTFGDWEDEDRQSFLSLAQAYKNEDPDFRKQLAEQLGFQLPPDETPQYLTQSDVAKMFEEREAQAEQRRSLDTVYERAESLGYKKGTLDQVKFLWHLNQGDTPDYEAADKAVKAEKQAHIDEYIKSRAAVNGAVPLQSDIDGAPARAADEPKTLSDSRKRAEARLAADRAGR